MKQEKHIKQGYVYIQNESTAESGDDPQLRHIETKLFGSNM